MPNAISSWTPPLEKDLASAKRQYVEQFGSILGTERAGVFLDQAERSIKIFMAPFTTAGSLNYTFVLRGLPEPEVYLAWGGGEFVEKKEALEVQTTPGLRLSGGGLGGATFPPEDDPFAPESMKPVLAEWRAQIQQLKNPSSTP